MGACGPSAAWYGHHVTYCAHVRCGRVLRCAAYNIPVFALVSTCVRTLFTLHAIPWCACPWRWWLCCACGGRPVCCVPTPSPALMAYREREEGGWLSWRLLLSILGPPFLVAFAAAGSCSFAIPCLCMLARVGIHTIHTILTSFRLGCPWVFPHTTPSHSVPSHGVGGLLFFICLLAVSTFWRWRLPLVLMAYRAREEGGFHVICPVGGCAGVAALCASFF